MAAPSIDEQFEQVVKDLGLADPKHSYPKDSPLTHTLNVARRNGSPYQPKHCGCLGCQHGFTHVAQVIV